MTTHTCNDGRGPAWGRKTPGCPRCDELANGATPRSSWRSQARREDDRRVAEIRDHFATAEHRLRCRGACTFGDS